MYEHKRKLQAHYDIYALFQQASSSVQSAKSLAAMARLANEQGLPSSLVTQISSALTASGVCDVSQVEMIVEFEDDASPPPPQSAPRPDKRRGDDDGAVAPNTKRLCVSSRRPPVVVAAPPVVVAPPPPHVGQPYASKVLGPFKLVKQLPFTSPQ